MVKSGMGGEKGVQERPILVFKDEFLKKISAILFLVSGSPTRPQPIQFGDQFDRKTVNQTRWLNGHRPTFFPRGIIERKEPGKLTYRPGMGSNRRVYQMFY